MDKIVYKFISKDELENSQDPIIFVITASCLSGLADDFIGDRELSDIELNRISQEMFDSYGTERFDLDNELFSVLGEVFKLDDAAWKEIDDKFKARQEAISKTAQDDKKL
jgi:hypothetical protein